METDLLNLCNKLRKYLFEGDQITQNSVKRCLKWALQTYKTFSEEGSNIILGHPYEYSTFKDLTRCEIFKQKLQNGQIQSLMDIDIFLQKLEKITTKRLPQLFYIYQMYPSLLKNICKTLFNLLLDPQIVASTNTNPSSISNQQSPGYAVGASSSVLGHQSDE